MERRPAYRYIFALARSGFPEPTHAMSPQSMSDDLRSAAASVLSKHRVAPVDLETATLLAALFFFCSGLGPFGGKVEAFWRRRGLHRVIDRLDWLLQDGQSLLKQGPLVGLGAMLWQHARSPWDEGNLVDALHVAYLPYVDLLVTNDAGMLGAVEAWGVPRWIAKITSVERWLRSIR